MPNERMCGKRTRSAACAGPMKQPKNLADLISSSLASGVHSLMTSSPILGLLILAACRPGAIYCQGVQNLLCFQIYHEHSLYSNFPQTWVVTQKISAQPASTSPVWAIHDLKKIVAVLSISTRNDAMSSIAWPCGKLAKF